MNHPLRNLAHTVLGFAALFLAPVVTRVSAAHSPHPATDAFWAYHTVALADDAIPKKYKELMAIAVALTTQCTYCI